ncbi:MAG: ABC transporter ATP-binding protein [Actinomycetota bacterium]|nr:ABC transporter ATP-binding protein [Actinomycetota bacterium]
MEKYIVELKNVVKKFGNFTAVDNISLKIKEGSFFSLLGPSGCGKTTTLRMIGGFIDTDKGDILIDSSNMKGVPPNKRSTSLVFQNLALFPHMNVKDNIIYGLKKRKTPPDIINEKLKRILNIVNLSGLEHRRITELSGGQQQRVALARSLIIEPEILLLDEPLANLDKKLRISMQYELKEIQKRIGTTFLYVTHDQGEALAMSDTIAVMNDGKIIQTGSPSEIYNHPSDIFVADFIGAGNFIELKALKKLGSKEFGNENIHLKDINDIQDNVEDRKNQPEPLTNQSNHVNEFESIICITKAGGKIIHRMKKDNLRKISLKDSAQNMVFFIRPEKISLMRNLSFKADNYIEDAENGTGSRFLRQEDIDSKEINFYQGIIESIIFEGPDIRLVINSNQAGRLKAEVKNERFFLGLTVGSSIDFFWNIEEGTVFF